MCRVRNVPNISLNNNMSQCPFYLNKSVVRKFDYFYLNVTRTKFKQGGNSSTVYRKLC